MSLQYLSIPLLVLLTASACARLPAAPSVEEMAGTAQVLAIAFMTQTVLAASPTPLPTETPSPAPTETATPNVTVTPEHFMPITTTFAGCYFGPGPQFGHETNIKKGKRVELLGMGSEPGWYIIRDPYFHRPCWIAFADLKLDPGVNTIDLPIMTPGEPGMGQ